MNILIIEDEPTIKDALIEDVIQYSVYFSECEIDFARTYGLAKNKLDSGKEYHLIFWDINLNKINSYDLWPHFPANAFILIFSETKDVLEKITEMYDGNINKTIKFFDRDIKEDINRKSKNGELELMQNKSDIFEEGTHLIHQCIERAVKRFGKTKIEFFDWNMIFLNNSIE